MEFSVTLVDILNIALIILVFILIYAALQLAGVLKNLRVASDKIREITEIVNNYFWQPVHFFRGVYKKYRTYADYFYRKKEEKNEKKKNSKSKEKDEGV